MLRHFDLEAVKGRYDALSYCWGEQTKSAVVIINDCTWSIGENLYAALKNLRSHEDRFMIWVDALCINQLDTHEKNMQVPIMRDIYFNSRRTYIWLGPDDIWTSYAFKEIELRAKGVRRHGNASNVGWHQWRQIYTGLEEEKPGILTRIMRKLDFLSWAERSIFARPWFSRCWVVQEIATSKAATIICGKYCINWSDMEMALQSGYINRYDDNEIYTLVSIRQRVLNSDTTNLETLLWYTNTFQTADPRDRIFSLLGLVSRDVVIASDSSHDPLQDTIRINYDASIRDIYIEATTQCLIKTSSAGILAASLGLRKTNLGDFPSWVLNPVPSREDLRGEDLFAWTLPNTGGWTAAGTSMCNLQFDGRNNLLGVQGIIVDIVDLVGAVREGSPHNPKAAGLGGIAGHVKVGASNIKCYFQWRAFSGVGTEEFYRGTTKTTEEAFYEMICPRMPTANENEQLRVRHLELSRRFDQFMLSTFGFMEQKIHGKLRKRELAQIVGKSARVVIEASFGNREDVAAAADFEGSNGLSVRRRFLRTRNGYIGLGGRDVEIGDKVILLAGSAAPFLIRSTSSGRYKIVSDAYVVGMMDGELWDSQRCSLLWLE